MRTSPRCALFYPLPDVQFNAAEEDYLLQDDAGEAKYQFTLADALKRAKELKGKLFFGHTFYVTRHVKIDPAMLKSVVLANGGQVRTSDGVPSFSD